MTAHQFPGTEAAVGTTYPYVEEAMIGRGIDLETNQVKERILKEDFETSSHKMTRFSGKYSMIEDMADETNLLDIGGRLKVAIEGGFSIGMEGAGEFTQRNRDLDQKLEALFSIDALDYYKVVRNIEFSGRPDCRTMTPEAKDVSHVVAGILYGAKCLVQITWDAKTDEEKRHIMGEFNLNFGKKDKFDIKVGGNVDLTNEANNTNYNYDMRVSCNMVIERLPTNFEELTAFVEELPQTYARVKTVPRGAPISMYVVPISEIRSCHAPPKTIDVGIPSSNAVIDQYFADLSVMIGDTQEVSDFLDKCKRAYEMPDDGSGIEIYTMQRAFYFMKRAVDRKAIILLQELNPEGKRRQFEKVEDVAAFVSNFEAIYADFQTMTSDSGVLKLFRRIAPNVKTVAENSVQERQIPTSNQATLGRNLWMQRAKLLCHIRKQLFHRLRVEF